MSTTTYLWPGQTHFGYGAVELVGPEAKKHGGTAVFIVTDPGIVQAGPLQPVLASLADAGLSYTIHDQIPSNPDTDSVDKAGAALRESGADLIVAVGGGSAIDAAKAVRILAGGPAEAGIAEYALMLGDDARPVPDLCRMPPMLAAPTTAGTGAEVTPWGVITDEARQLKMGVGGPATVPTMAILDPMLTLTLPPYLTAATGMDALTHLVEAYVSTNSGPVGLDAMILDGIGRIGRFLRVAVAQPEQRQAREELLLAAMLGGIAISSKWLGACHSLAHQLSGFADVHHGLACALMLPHQMAFSLPGALARYAQIGQALAPNTALGSLRAQAEWAVTAVRELMADLGMPLRLRDVGVSEEVIPGMAKNAMIDLNWTTNPRRVTEADMAEMYRKAF